MPVELSASRVLDCDADIAWLNLTHPPTINRLNWKGVYGEISHDVSTGRRFIRHSVRGDSPVEKEILCWQPPDRPFTQARFRVGSSADDWDFDFLVVPHAGGVEVTCTRQFAGLNAFERELEEEGYALGLHENRMHSYQESCETTIECFASMVRRYFQHGLFVPKS